MTVPTGTVSANELVQQLNDDISRVRLTSIAGPYADNAAALAAGLVAGDVYYVTTTGALHIVI